MGVVFKYSRTKTCSNQFLFFQPTTGRCWHTVVYVWAHIHQPTARQVPHTCTEPYYPGSGSHGKLFRPYLGSSARQSSRVNERGKPVSQKPFTAEASAKHSFDPTAMPCWWAPIRARQLLMAATAGVIWLCACVRYRPGRGLMYVCPLP